MSKWTPKFGGGNLGWRYRWEYLSIDGNWSYWNGWNGESRQVSIYWVRKEEGCLEELKHFKVELKGNGHQKAVKISNRRGGMKTVQHQPSCFMEKMNTGEFWGNSAEFLPYQQNPVTPGSASAGYIVLGWKKAEIHYSSRQIHMLIALMLSLEREWLLLVSLSRRLALIVTIDYSLTSHHPHPAGILACLSWRDPGHGKWYSKLRSYIDKAWKSISSFPILDIICSPLMGRVERVQEGQRRISHRSRA